MARLLPLAALALVAVTSSAALASPRDYCEAYARDFADRGPKKQDVWKARQSNALADCLLQFQPANAAQDGEVQPQPQPEKKPPRTQVAKAKHKPEPPLQDAAVEPLPDPAVIVAPDIEPPAKPQQSATGGAKRKTLFAKLFPPKDAAAAPSGAAEPVSGDGKLVPGSEAWLDYCDRKYASFNRDTGTYKSYKGIVRKCLVTD